MGLRVAANQASCQRRDFYVYVHRRKSDGSIFYVGKGCGRRAWKRIGRNSHWQNIVAKHGFAWEIVHSGLTEDEAIASEVSLIASLGRDALCNLTDGGEGMSGHVKSEAAKQAVSRAHKGQKRGKKWRQSISDGLKGREVSHLTKAKLSEAHKGQRLSAETRNAMSEAHKGKQFSAEHRANMVKAWAEPDQKARRKAAMSAAREGVAVVCIDTGEQFEKVKKMDQDPAVQATVDSYLNDLK